MDDDCYKPNDGLDGAARRWWILKSFLCVLLCFLFVQGAEAQDPATCEGCQITYPPIPGKGGIFTRAGITSDETVPANNSTAIDYRRIVDLLNEGQTIVDRPVTQYLRSNAGPIATRLITGVLHFTSGSMAVTGTGTKFTTQLQAGSIIKLASDADTRWGEVITITNDTHLSLWENYTGATASGLGVAGLAHLPFGIRVNLTGGSPNTSSAGESVALSILTRRAATSNRVMFAANFNSTFQGKGAGASTLELDLNNYSTSDWAQAGEIIHNQVQRADVLRIVSSGLHRAQSGIVFDAGATGGFQYGVDFNPNAVSNICGIACARWKGSAGVPTMMFIPDADNAQAEMVFNNAANDTTKAAIYKNGTADFTSVRLGLDQFISAAPRNIYNCFLPGALSSLWTGCTWIPDAAVIVERVQIRLKTAPATCTTQASIRTTNGSNPIDTVTSNTVSVYDSGVVSAAYASGATVTVAIVQAAATCGTLPADANVVVQYRMQ
jgi:hypothetical protein